MANGLNMKTSYRSDTVILLSVQRLAHHAISIMITVSEINKIKRNYVFAITIINNPMQHIHSIIHLKCTNVSCPGSMSANIHILCLIQINSKLPRYWFNMEVFSCQYRKSHCIDKTIVRWCSPVWTRQVAGVWIRLMTPRCRISSPVQLCLIYFILMGLESSWMAYIHK